jgi:hypothetical protein
MSATHHFMQRVHERMGGHVNPMTLAGRLLRAIEASDEAEVQFVARVSKDGRRIFRFEEGGREFFALVNTHQKVCISVFLPGYEVGRQNQPRLTLR